jgi:hypothetical protein
MTKTYTSNSPLFIIVIKNLKPSGPLRAFLGLCESDSTLSPVLFWLWASLGPGQFSMFVANGASACTVVAY